MIDLLPLSFPVARPSLAKLLRDELSSKQRRKEKRARPPLSVWQCWLACLLDQHSSESSLGIMAPLPPWLSPSQSRAHVGGSNQAALRLVSALDGCKHAFTDNHFHCLVA
jgi:hypothetical protein